MNRLPLLLLLTFLVWGSAINAQTLNLLDPGFPVDTVPENTIHPFSGNLLNGDSLPYQGSVFVFAGLSNGPGVIAIDSTILQGILLNGFSTQSFTLNLDVSVANGFQYGLNNVSIWANDGAFFNSDTITIGIVMVHDPFQFLDLSTSFGMGAIPDTVIRDAQDFIPVNLTNTGAFNYSEMLTVYMGVENDDFLLLDSLDYQLTINAGDSVPFGFPIEYSISNNFDDGGNIIVIWPRAPQTTPDPVDVDSLKLEVWVGTHTGTADGDAFSNRIMAYPNPASTVLNLSSDEPIDAVSILDLSGRVVASALHSNSINIEALPKGIYIVEVTTRSKNTAKLRLMKQ